MQWSGTGDIKHRSQSLGQAGGKGAKSGATLKDIFNKAISITSKKKKDKE